MRQKIFTIFLTFLLSTVNLFAASTVTINGITYKLNQSLMTAQVISASDGTKYSDEVVIPASIVSKRDMYQGNYTYNVTGIGEKAFYYCDNLTSITIPNSVTSIGKHAFYGCNSLAVVTIPSSVISIRDAAFSNCSGLISINVNDNNPNYSSVSGVLFNKEKTTLITYPGGKQGEYSIPNSVTSIGEEAFSYCSNLTSITIPNSVTSIGKYAFYDCSGLNSMIIPNGVTSIGYRTFARCRSLTSVTIPNSVTIIGDEAFSDCRKLTSVTIPNSVTSIGDEAFSWCGSLTSATIPNSVTIIRKGAFTGCSGLASIIIETSNPIYDSRDNCNAIIETSSNTLILGCKKTIIPNSVTNIGDKAFYYCSNLTSITIPNSVKSIGEEAFYECIGLTSVIIPNSVTNIGNEAFGGCESLTSVTIGNSVTSIGEGAFVGCNGLTSVTIPNSVTSIGERTFAGCSDLISVTIPNSITSISSDAFRECTSASIDIPNNVVSIGTNAFLNVPNVNYYGPANGRPWGALLVNNHRPQLTVTEIRTIASQLSANETSNQFYLFTGKISAIKEIDTEYGNATFTITDGTSAFTCFRVFNYYGTHFTDQYALHVGDSVVISSKVHNYKGNTPEATLGYLTYHSANLLFTPDGELYYGLRNNDSYDVKLYYALDLDTLNVPSAFSYNNQEYTVTEITRGAFYDNQHMKCVILPVTLTNMSRAFEKCGSVQTIYYNARNLDMPTRAPFSNGGKNVTTIYVGEDVEMVPRNCFDSLSNVTTVHWNAVNCLTYQDGQYIYPPFVYIPTHIQSFIIGENVETIPSGLCYKMPITSVRLPETVSAIGVLAFGNCSNLTKANMPENLTAIEYATFAGCTNLKQITIPENVTTIGDAAFWGCENLTSIEIPNSVTSIGSCAFQECAKLNMLSLGDNITSYGDSAFAGCPNISTIYNYRKTPAKLGKDVFFDVDYFNSTLYVLAESVDMYKSSGSDWKDFYFVKPIGAESVNTETLEVTPMKNAACVVWPLIENADTYEMEVKDKECNTICVLVFNAYGYLKDISFGAPARKNVSQQVQENGFSFTITGLNTNTTYELTLIAKNSAGDAIDEKKLLFTTQGTPTSLDQINTDQNKATKVLQNGQLLILRGDNTYTLDGQQVK